MLDLTLLTLLCWSATGGRDCMKKKVVDTTHEPYRVCYYTNWARYRPGVGALNPGDIDPFLCTHLISAFADIAPEGVLDLNKPEDELVINELVQLKLKNPKLKILTSVGGANAGSEPFRRISSSQEARSDFVKSAAQFLEKYSLDGLDIHWEYPEWQDGRSFGSLISDLGSLLHDKSLNRSYILSAAVPALSSRLPGYDVSAMKLHLDFINVKTYDFNGPWNNRTGHNAPLYSNDGFDLAEGAKLWVNLGFPRPKIVVGVPMYGHAFRLTDKNRSEVGAPSVGGAIGAFTGMPGFLSYFEVCEELKRDGTSIFWDHFGSVPYAVRDDVWISFDDPKSLENKLEWILNEQFGGVMVWDISMDDFSGSFCGKGREDSFPLLKTILRYKSIVPIVKHTSHHVNETEHELEHNHTSTLTPLIVECNFTNAIGHNCSHFSMCQDSKLVDMVCADGLAFDKNASQCSPVSLVLECASPESNNSSSITESSSSISTESISFGSTEKSSSASTETSASASSESSSVSNHSSSSENNHSSTTGFESSTVSTVSLANVTASLSISENVTIIGETPLPVTSINVHEFNATDNSVEIKNVTVSAMPL